MASITPYLGNGGLGRLFNQYGQNADINQANIYRKALEKAAYGDFGRDYGVGLNDITNYLARSGPLADSGAGTALRAKLASQLYGKAQSRIQGGYADYLRQLQLMRLQNQYQLALQKQAQKGQKQGFWGTLGGLAGGIAGVALPGLGGSKAATSWSQTPWGS